MNTIDNQLSFACLEMSRHHFPDELQIRVAQLIREGWKVIEWPTGHGQFRFVCRGSACVIIYGEGSVPRVVKVSRLKFGYIPLPAPSSY